MGIATTYDEFSSDISGSSVFAFNSVEENEEVLQRHSVNQNTRQLGKGSFRSHLATRSMEQADFFSDRYSTFSSMHLELPKDSVGFLFPRTVSGKFIASGVDIGNDQLLVLSNGCGTDIVCPDLSGSEDIAISKARYDAMCDALFPNVAPPEAMSIVKGDTQSLHALRRGVLSLLAQPDFIPSSEQVSNLIAETLIWMGESLGPRRPEGHFLNRHRVRIAMQARDYIEAHYGESIGSEELCRETGVGVRTVQRSFQEYFNCTPTEYLKTVRLDAAHRKLGILDPSLTTVSAVALQYGFNHLGRFSIEFRERFGESPREVLVAQSRVFY
jgi:AraC-like DNA-binding protein